VDEIISAAGGDFTFIDGVAFHWYGNNLENYQYLQALHDKYPKLPLLGTEATLKDPRTQGIGRDSPWVEAQKYAVDVIGDLNAGAEGWIEWNVLLDKTGGPTCIGTTNLQDCIPDIGHCDAPILADTVKQTLEYRDTFWLMAHFTRFLPRGSKLLKVTNATEVGLQFTAAVTPERKLVVVVLNTNIKGRTMPTEQYQLDLGGGMFVTPGPIPGHGIHTIVVDLDEESAGQSSSHTAPAPATADAYSSFRADAYADHFPETGTKKPTVGGRVQIVLPSFSDSSGLASVKINGQEATGLSSSTDLKYFDWFRSVHTGTQLFLSFHSRNPDWFVGGDKESKPLTVEIATEGGAKFSSTTTARPPLLDLSYVSFSKDGTEAYLHIHSSGKGGTVERILFNGEVVPPLGGVDVPVGGHALVTVALGAPGQPATLATGDVWSAVLFFTSDEQDGHGFGGRVPPPRFPILAWPHTSDCSVPGANDTNAGELKKLGIDSVFYKGKEFSKTCGKDLVDLVTQSGVHVATDHDTAASMPGAVRGRLLDTVFCGDEVDGDIDADHLRGALKDSEEAYGAAPGSLSYQGSKTNHNVGAFAGITDIQGADAYAGACAPTMLAVDHALPYDYPFVYLRNARDNHKPLPFWGYSQLYSEAWNYQANANEIVAQIAQVLLSGSKAVMLFQSLQDQFTQHNTGVIQEALRMIGAVREQLRIGDVGGMQLDIGKATAQAEAIRSNGELIVVVLNAKASGYSNLLCHTGVGRHWSIVDYTVPSLKLQRESAVGVSSIGSWQEALGTGKLGPLADGATVSADGAELTNIKLSGGRPMRIFLAKLGA
jgi:hypothetical protein